MINKQGKPTNKGTSFKKKVFFASAAALSLVSLCTGQDVSAADSNNIKLESESLIAKEV